MKHNNRSVEMCYVDGATRTVAHMLVVFTVSDVEETNEVIV